MKAYRVAQWNENFETSRSREVKDCRYVCVPNRHDGETYGELMAQEDPRALFACWNWIVQVASRCRVRGLLTRDNGTPHTPRSLATKVRGKEEWFTSSLKWFLEVGWLEEVDVSRTQDGELTLTDPNGAAWSLPRNELPPGCRPAADPLPPNRRPAAAQAPKEREREGQKDLGVTPPPVPPLSLSLEAARPEGARAAAQEATPGPATKAAMLDLAMKEAVGTDCFTAFWSHFEACGWLDAKGRRIQDPLARFERWIVDWKHRTHSRTGKREGPRASPPPGNGAPARGPARVPLPLGEAIQRDPVLAGVVKGEIDKMKLVVRAVKP